MPWYADPIWSFVATVAQVLSLLAIAFAVYELASRAWRVSDGVIRVNQWGTATNSDPGRLDYMVDIINVGGGPALLTALLVVEGRIVPDPSMRVKYWLAPGESMTVAVEADDPKKVWFRFQWVSPSDRRFAHGSWQVMQSGTPLHDKWTASYDRTKGLPFLFSAFRGFWPHKVGPDADVRTRIRITRDAARSGRRAATVFGGHVENSTVWLLGGAADESPRTEPDPQSAPSS